MSFCGQAQKLPSDLAPALVVVQSISNYIEVTWEAKKRMPEVRIETKSTGTRGAST